MKLTQLAIALSLSVVGVLAALPSYAGVDPSFPRLEKFSSNTKNTTLFYDGINPQTGNHEFIGTTLDPSTGNRYSRKFVVDYSVDGSSFGGTFEEFGAGEYCQGNYTSEITSLRSDRFIRTELVTKYSQGAQCPVGGVTYRTDLYWHY